MNFKRFIIAVLIASVCVTTSIAYAQDIQNPDYKQEEIVTIAESDVVDKDFFGVGEVVEISGVVNGDVYAAAGDIAINGQVNGDVLAAGGRVYIAQGARVSQDVRAAGGKVIVEGSVGQNITAVGGMVRIGNDATVEGNVTVAGGEVLIETPLTKNLKAAGGSVTIDAVIAGDAEVATGDLRFLEGARIEGDLTYASDRELSIDEAVVTGSIVHYNPPQDAMADTSNKQDGVAKTFFVFEALALIAKLLIGLLFIHLLPEFSRKAASHIQTSPWRSLGSGFLIVVLTPILIIALMITVIGLPIGFILLAAYMLALYIAPIFVMFAIGQALATRFKKTWNDGWMLLLGLLVVAVLKFIPGVNILATMLIGLLGVGTLFTTKMEVYNDLRKKKLI